VGKFEAVPEGSTGCENRIPQAQRANFYAEVNGANGTHFVEENNTNCFLPFTKFGALRFPFADYEAADN
jgi:hypothetical protein